MARYALLRLRHRQEQAEPVTEVNIIPVIDISLVLLVILFVTAPLLSVPNIPVDMPRSSAPESQEPTIAVTYMKEGRMTLSADETDWYALPSALAERIKKQPQATVVLRVDKAVPYRVVQRLMGTAKTAGASKIALGTEPYK